MKLSAGGRIGAALLTSLFVSLPRAGSEPVAVRYSAGLLHGFLKLSTTDGSEIADGDLVQMARGNRVTSHLVFRFKDRSLLDETTVFSQRNELRMISYRLVQRGPSFPRPLELSIDSNGLAIATFTDEHGQPTTEREQVQTPADLANGLVPTLLENARADAAPTQFPFVVATPKPRVVKLNVHPPVEETFLTGGVQRKALHYAMKVEIGGLSGVVAPIIGKQPPDQHVWILGGEAPAFVKSEQQFYPGGPVWRIELVAPSWPQPRR